MSMQKKLINRRICSGTNSPPTEVSFVNINIINYKTLF